MVSREQFIKAMVASVEDQLEVDKQLAAANSGSGGVSDLSPVALSLLEERALAAVADMGYDYPNPRADDAEALLTSLAHFVQTGGGRRHQSLFAREFSISRRFLEGLVYCSSRHAGTNGPSAEGGTGVGAVPTSNASGLTSAAASELAALVLVK